MPPFLLSCLTFAVVFSVLVIFHELGHFLAAKSFRMRVEEFAIGMFEPHFRLFSDGQTDYNLRAIPIGGFVRIAGMEITDPEADEPDTQTPDGFNKRPIYQRFVVYLAGPVFSLLLGYLAFCAKVYIYGAPDGPPTTRVAMVVGGSPAQAAGLQAGDTVIAVNGKKVQFAEDMIDAIRGNGSRPLALSVAAEGTGTVRLVNVTPRMETVEGKQIPRIGVLEDSNRLHVTVGGAMIAGWREVILFFTLLGRLVQTHQIANAIGGPVAIAGEVGEARQQGLDAVMDLMGQLSLSLGMCNLLPVPVLDGGHLALLTLEAVRRRKLTAAQTVRVLMAGVAIIGVLFVVVTVRDVAAKVVAARQSAAPGASVSR